MNKPKAILYILIGFLLLAGGYAYFQYPRQSRVADSVVIPKAQVRLAVHSKTKQVEDNRFRIRFDWLKNQKPFSGAKEDLFGPLYSAKKGLSIVPVQKKTSVPVSKKTVTRRVSLPPLEFIGFLASGKSRTYFLSQGEDIFVAKKGAKFGKNREFSVVAETSKEIKIRKQGDTELLNISLVEKKAVSGFNKLKPVKREESREESKTAEGEPFSADFSDFKPQPPAEPDEEREKMPPPQEQEFRPEGDWAK